MTDFATDESGGVVIRNGDLTLRESTVQHQKDLIVSEKGWWHHNPTVGVGLTRWLNDHSIGGLPGVVRGELERDGQEVKNISVAEGKLSINADYP